MYKQALILLLFIVSYAAVKAQKKPSQKPKLVVYLLIDQLSTSQLNAFENHLSDYGIKRMIYGGAVFSNASYSATSSYYGTNLASLYTGANASTHGIVSDWWYNRLREKEVSAAYGDITGTDKDTALTANAQRLLSSSINDELKWMNNNASKVASIGYSDNFLIWTGGQQPDFLYHIDPNTGDFITGSKNDTLKSIPNWVDEFNKKDLLKLYSRRDWGPLQNLNRYYQLQYFSDQRSNSNSFMYPLTAQEGKGKYIPVIHSPYGNKYIRDFAMSLIINENFGKDDNTDIISLQLSTQSVHGNNSGFFDAETEDMFLRLDQEIADLLKVIDNEVGLENTLVVTTSVTAPNRSISENTKHAIPTGVFNGTKAQSLLNLFLMAKYGQGKWVMTYYDGQLYLNHQLIKEHKLNLNEIKHEASLFIADMKGVAYAMAIEELKNLATDMPALRSIRNNYHPLRSGDIIIKTKPGWIEELDNGVQIYRRWTDTYVPLMLYGWKIKTRSINAPTPMIDIAPTISSFLKIPFPNGNEGKPIQGIIEE